MASLAETVTQVGTRLGLKSVPGKPIAYGVKDGHLVQVAQGVDGRVPCITTIVRYGDPARDAAVRDAVAASADVAAAGVKAPRVRIVDGVLVHNHRKPTFGALDADAVTGGAEALLRAIAPAAPPMAARCRLCGSDSGAEPILVNDVVDRICPACVERLQHEAKRAREAYADAPLNMPLALVVAAVLAAAGALAWAGIAVATSRAFWLVAIGIGLAIGWSVSRVAGKGGPVTQTIVVAFTVASVLLGELLVVAYYVNQRAARVGRQVDWVAFLGSAPQILWSLGTDTLFALGGGLIGAWYAARLAARPRIEVRVDRS